MNALTLNGEQVTVRAIVTAGVGQDTPCLSCGKPLIGGHAPFFGITNLKEKTEHWVHEGCWLEPEQEVNLLQRRASHLFPPTGILGLIGEKPHEFDSVILISAHFHEVAEKPVPVAIKPARVKLTKHARIISEYV